MQQGCVILKVIHELSLIVIQDTGINYNIIARICHSEVYSWAWTDCDILQRYQLP